MVFVNKKDYLLDGYFWGDNLFNIVIEGMCL